MQTHESYIHAVAAIGIARLQPDEVTKLETVKIVYGTGGIRSRRRGTTFHEQWSTGGETPVDLIEICAFGESDLIQVAGTTLHELGHALNRPGEGHGGAWKAACVRLGLRGVKAARQMYTLDDSFAPGVAEAIQALDVPTDGAPAGCNGAGSVTLNWFKGGCSAGIGTQGGKSRGAGSGSRMVKVSCGECGYIARTTRRWLKKAGAPLCPCKMVEGVDLAVVRMVEGEPTERSEQ